MASLPSQRSKGNSGTVSEVSPVPIPIMKTISRHYFGEEETKNVDIISADGDHRGFYIDIIENIEETYGMFVWPCSIALAEYVWQQRARFSGTTVVELGSGTSLPGFVAAKVGSSIVMTDNSDKLEVLDNIRATCELNKVKCEVMGLAWGKWDAPIFNLNPQIVLGADVFYDNKDFDDLFATVTFLLQQSPGSVFITTYHNRSGHHRINFLILKWGLKCEKLLDVFCFMPSHKAANLHGSIQLAEITLNVQNFLM